MRKLLVLTLALVLVIAFAIPASAAIRNTIHDFQSNKGGTQSGFGIGGNRGMCSYCHIPHSARGDRLWPSPGTSSQSDFGLVGRLCASCHRVGASMDNDNSGNLSVTRTDDVYSVIEINHVLVDDYVYANDTDQQLVGISSSTQFNQVSIWPYCATEGSGGNGIQTIECSSCHNPHNEWPEGIGTGGQSTITAETNSQLGYGNDYLRASMFNTDTGVAFCEYCHEEKTRGGAAGNAIGTGTHPVGSTANAGDSAQADIHIESAERAGLQASRIVSPIFYDMDIHTTGTIPDAGDDGPGTHLTSYDTGGVTCQSCHMIHGAPAGSSDTNDVNGSQGNYGATGTLAASDDGYANVLAIENDASGGTNGYIGWNYPSERRSDAADYNDLCIDCHETTPSVGPNALASYSDSATYAADTAGDDIASSGNGYPADAHPVNIAPDGYSEVGFDLSVKDPGWTDAARWAGDGIGANRQLWDDGTKHIEAISLTVSGRWDGNSAVGTPRSEIVCLTCHSIHTGVNGTPILRSSNTTFCQDCHLRSLGRVSHPVGNGSAMYDNPDAATWPNGDSLPLANYYDGAGGSSFDKTVDNTTDMACFTCHAAHDGIDGYMLRVSDDNSRICTGCHTDFKTTGEENPSNYIAEYGEGATVRQGSHYTGTVEDSGTRTGETRWAYSGNWTATTDGGATAQTSHWNGGAASVSRLQCQSCHTPHNAAMGLVEANVYDGNVTSIIGRDWYFTGDAGEPSDPATNFDEGGPMCNTPTSALLLGNNARSNICATCHWPSGTHVTTIYTTGAKPDPQRAAGGELRRYRDYCTRIESFIITILHANQEQQYNVYDLLADLDITDGSTPESPTNFPPVFVGTLTTNEAGEMVCDSCHAPHGAINGPGAFILEAGTGDANTLNLERQRVDSRNFDDLCWKCHDK